MLFTDNSQCDFADPSFSLPYYRIPSLCKTKAFQNPKIFLCSLSCSFMYRVQAPMDPDNGVRGTPQSLSTEILSLFTEGISLILSRWTALQMAVENEWGGRTSRQKFQQLSTDIVSWFSQSNAPLYIDDLEMMLDETMVLSFSSEIEDGSIEEVAEQLMILHEECLKGNFETLYQLRASSPATQAVSQSRKVSSEEGSDYSTDDEQEPASDMALDIEPEQMAVNPVNSMSSSKVVQLSSEEIAEGWAPVTSRRNRGKRSA
ncbi:hypothetical protein AMTRI_Chr03g148850 [Amborella trichopoda]